MNKLTNTSIDALAEIKEMAVLSMYMPTHKISTPATTKEDQARYRNMIKDGLDQWESVVGVDVAKSARDELESYIEDPVFWSSTCKSIALFVSAGDMQIYCLPIECDEYIHVGETFDLAPLRVVQSQMKEFYVLALAKHNPRLYFGDAYSLEPLEIELPTSPEDALNIDEMFSGSNTIRGVSAPGGGNDMLSSHGQGDSNHAGQEEHLKYLRIIDNKILKSANFNADLPLIIAATENEAGDFKRISNNSKLVDQVIAGNHTITPLQDLHELAWSVITESVLEPSLTDLLERFNEGKGRQKASSDLGEIKEALTAGKVDTLLLGIIEHTNDSVSDISRSFAPHIRLHNGYQTHQMAEFARSVVEQGGRIIGIAAEKLATPTKIAALYRY